MPSSTRVIGPARGGWDGGERDVAIDGRIARGGHEARSHRDLLLPALHAVQDRVGWISPGALGYICRRLTVPPAEAYGVAIVLRAAVHGPAAAAPSSTSATTWPAASPARRASARTWSASSGPPATRRAGGEQTWTRSPCLGQCERAPAALFTIAGDPPDPARPRPR